MEDKAYFERRAREERDAAERAGSLRSRDIHLELARLYEQRLRTLKREHLTVADGKGR